MSLETGRNYSSLVQTGTGVLTADGDITVNPNTGGFGVTDGSSPAASITGNLSLTGALDANNASQQFITNPTFVVSANPTLSISATLGEVTPIAATDGSVGLYVPGLREATVAGADNVSGFGAIGTAQLFPRSGEVFSGGTATSYNPAGVTIDYTGQFFLPNATQVSFAASADDYAALSVDGTLYDNVQLGGGFSSTVSLNSGWHNLDLRVSNNTGPGGANGALGLTANFGAGWAPFGDTNTTTPGSGMIMPIDNGSSTVFRAATGNNDAGLIKTGLGTLAVNGASSLTGPTTINQGELIFNGQGKIAGIENAVQLVSFVAPSFGSTATSQLNINAAQAAPTQNTTGGTFTLTFNGQTTGAITYAAPLGPAEFRAGRQSDRLEYPGGVGSASGHRQHWQCDRQPGQQLCLCHHVHRHLGRNAAERPDHQRRQPDRYRRDRSGSRRHQHRRPVNRHH